jgi:diaminopimelate epimerase
MPEGHEFGLRPLPFEVAGSAGFGFVGNPQLVIEVPNVAAVDLAHLAPPLRHHPALPGGTNVNIVDIVRPGRARIRSWERGVEGETQCCGTGCAVAAAWLCERTGVADWTLETAGGEPVTVTLEWQSPGRWANLWVAGPVRRLGTLELAAGLVPPK